MKKSLMIVFGIALALAACKNEGKQPGPAPTPEAAAEITPAPPVTPGPQSKEEQKFDFRAATWGMSKAEVKAAERKQPLYEDEGSLTFDGRYKGQFVYITYQFKDDKLYRAGVLYSQKHDSDSKYLENYENLKSAITKEYGAPVIDGEKQLNPGAVIEKDKEAEAVCRGDLMYGAQWNVPGSMVVLMIRGDGKKCLVSLIYASEESLKSISEMDGSGSIGIAE
ncbi:MAG: hypothetical protein AB1598_05820 [Thermodesulfobacteriota bacterium]